METSVKAFLRVMVAWWLCVGAGAQVAAVAGAARPAFEVASVREHKEGIGSSIGMYKGRYTAKNMPLSGLISGAYDVRVNLISGLPGWAESTRYDIEAKVDEAEAGAMEKMSPKDNVAEQGKLVRALLEERFHLLVKLIEKELPDYELVIAKGGLKMKEADANIKYKKGVQNPSGPRPGSFQVNTSVGGTTKMTSQGFPFPNFVANLGGQFDRKVVDKTGLTGKYDFVLQWTPDSAAGTDSPWPDLFVALEEQLGLKLVPGKGPTQTMVVEHIERPTEN